MSGLNDKKIGVAAARNSEAIAKLIQNNGGTSFIYSVQGEQVLDEEVSRKNVLDFIRDPFDQVLLTTGIGLETLEKAANDLDCLSDFIGNLRNSKLAIRGSKTANWLKRHSLSPKFVSEDGTMESLLAQLALDDDNNRLFLQAYSQDEAVLKKQLEHQGYAVYLSKPYEYMEPDLTIMTALRKQIITRSLDAVVFTSKTQIQNLFKGSSEAEELTAAFHDHVLPVGVGKVTTAELRKNGVTTAFHPGKPKMGAMIVELANFFSH
ncbi:uroporphyrinogen-III synthase [Virgibacillus ihumii]|uniref:uroporphyrinogen-III synthase n=1 Tax=Virgibacillus ihumii TaxID=2686091 RepID=UPI00157E0539|nr:uroporphyrinogen-III synthase [Virgibacillus ihumii]